MPNFAVIEVSDVEGKRAVWPSTFSGPYQPVSYLSIDIVFPNIIGSSGEEDMSDSGYSETHTTTSSAGWSMFCTSIDVDGDYDGSDGSFINTKNLSAILNPQENPSGNIIIVKDNAGSAYLPEWDFNGIGDLINGQAYQVKLGASQSFSFTGNPLSEPDANGNRAYGSFVPLVTGWNMIGNPLPAVDGLSGEVLEHPTWAMVLSTATNSDFGGISYLPPPLTGGSAGTSGTIQIVKDYLGSAFLPEWNFDGIGQLVAGQGYQVKIYAPGPQVNSGSLEITM